MLRHREDYLNRFNEVYPGVAQLPSMQPRNDRLPIREGLATIGARALIAGGFEQMGVRGTRAIAESLGTVESTIFRQGGKPLFPNVLQLGMKRLEQQFAMTWAARATVDARNVSRSDTPLHQWVDTFARNSFPALGTIVAETTGVESDLDRIHVVQRSVFDSSVATITGLRIDGQPYIMPDLAVRCADAYHTMTGPDRANRVGLNCELLQDFMRGLMPKR